MAGKQSPTLKKLALDILNGREVSWDEAKKVLYPNE